MKKTFLLSLTSLLLIGCTAQAPAIQDNQPQIQQPTSTQATVAAEQSSVITGNIYENKTYKFKFTLLAGSNPISTSPKPGASFDPIYGVFLPLGGSMNTTIDIYNKEADREELQDIKNGTNYYKYTKRTSANGTEYWQSGPTVGTANALFLTTVIYGKNYVYEIITSDENNSKNFASKHNAIVDSFKVE